MVINHQLRVALLISLLCHLFWMSFVSIIFLPQGLQAQNYSSVYFFGSILTGPVAILDARAPLDRRPYPENQSFLLEMEAQRESSDRLPKSSLPIEKETFNLDDFIDLDAPGKIAPFISGFSPAEISSQREIIFQPPYPQYPEWSQQEFRDSSVVFKVYISADGLVEQLINVQGSGNPEIDVVLARYIRKWRFAPSCEQQGQWQIVKINHLQANN